MEDRWETLGGAFGVWVNRSHTFGTDALLLARFALECAPHARRMADMGTGCGIIPLLWAQERPQATLFGLEYQDTAAEMARKSVCRSGVSDRVTVCTGDLRDWTVPPAERFDLIACNPPYFPTDSGAPAADPARQLARAEAECTLTDAASAAARNLTGTGWFCMIHRAERLCAVTDAMRGAGLEPKRMQLVQSDALHAPKLVLVAGRKNAKPGLQIAPTRLLNAAPVLFAKSPDGESDGENVENSV